MPIINKGELVLVSGANGYLAMWIVRAFLERGYTVRGTVRNDAKAMFVKAYFSALGYGEKFEAVIVADITEVLMFLWLPFAALIFNKLSRKAHLTTRSRVSTRSRTRPRPSTFKRCIQMVRVGDHISHPDLIATSFL